MPELPEVQTIVNDLTKKVVGRRIIGVWFDWPKMLQGFRGAVFAKAIKGKKILKVNRRAKNILIYLSDGLLLLIHLKMTGHLIIGRWRIEKRHGKEAAMPLEPKEAVSDPYNQYIHLIFYLDNGKMIGFSDLRKFGKAVLGEKERIENLPELIKLGLEPFDKNFTFGQFKKIILNESRKIKQVLMDQKVIAGIGNIYSDDILWAAKIHPFKPANKLVGKELMELWKAMRGVLLKGLELRGASISDYRDTAGKKGGYDKARLVYQREGEPCYRCKTKIKRVKLGGRSAHYCPKCQKLK